MIAFLEAHRAGLFRRDSIWQNAVAGVIVGIVALPLPWLSRSPPAPNLAALLFMRRMAELVSVQEQVFGKLENGANGNEALEGVTLPATALVYRIDGPFFFGAAEELESTLERVQLHVETVVIRLGRVPFMDATGLQTLSEIIRTSVPTCARWCGRSVVHTKLLEALGAKLALAGLFRQAAIQNQDIRMQK